jgi:hypothetical protein
MARRAEHDEDGCLIAMSHYDEGRKYGNVTGPILAAHETARWSSRLHSTCCAAGKFFEGYVVFMTGVALPLITREFHFAPAQVGSCMRSSDSVTNAS